MPVSLRDKEKRLQEIIGREGRAAVACSGGVDSSLLLKFVLDGLGPENVIAVFADTPLIPSGERRDVEEIVELIGSRLLCVSLDPLRWPEFTANPLERCYLCKKKIYRTFLEKLAEMNFQVLMDGTNLDDLGDFRPGLKALDELKVRSPLAEAGLTKKDIRQLSRKINLPTWSRHSSSCLATRIVTGQQINRDKLALVQRCEKVLHGSGFAGCRVRLSGDTATIELLEEDIDRFCRDGSRITVLKKINDFGVKKVFLSLDGRRGLDL